MSSDGDSSSSDYSSPYKYRLRTEKALLAKEKVFDLLHDFLCLYQPHQHWSWSSQIACYSWWRHSLSVFDPTNPVFGQDKKNKKEISDPSFEQLREYVLIDLEKVSKILLPLTADVLFNERGLFLDLSHFPSFKEFSSSPVDVMRRAATRDGTMILTTLNEAWAAPGPVIDLFLECFKIGKGTRKFLMCCVELQ
ncbi:hypothetical protein ISN45_Aa01g029810 [Arabidopsis thaliana x Arabidopsis arenosa]|uniref:Uncharacterized protein n=1 Tax=Arabidopsis thaliana x Arabidopsis arenosa TaxID=1240361 RepID=A0A8T2C8U9_9BRAS|nr:hypothetical protein ISN45_Aa01g029810 [Arabidopsis thaliana x Arabidopsis arenosa]